MNALWINRMSAYQHSPYAIESARAIIEAKIQRERVLLAQHGVTIAKQEITPTATMSDVLLYEARAAKIFWNNFRKLLPAYEDFEGRTPRGVDVVNRLLDIGFHHLTNKVRILLDTHDTSSVLALLHTAHRADAAPLAYDLVELFRADIVDAELLRSLHLKKKRIVKVSQHTVAHFLAEINKRCARKHYLKDFHSCRSYAYYMELQIVHFINSVNHRKAFVPLSLPNRHESRCTLIT